MSADPKSVKVHKTSGNSMDIEWKDGREPGDPQKPVAGALPLFKALARPTEVEPVGKYAIRFTWNDSHQHGIYSWEYLREICPCPECKMYRESTRGLAEDMHAHDEKKRVQ